VACLVARIWQAVGPDPLGRAINDPPWKIFWNCALGPRRFFEPTVPGELHDAIARAAADAFAAECLCDAGDAPLPPRKKL
jgi:hypothetical protein